MIIGTCSQCGGPVYLPDVWASVLPPTPTCMRCGAIAAKHGPVIPMVLPQKSGLNEMVRTISEVISKRRKDEAV